MDIVSVFLVCYFVSSIPFAFLFSKWSSGHDVRFHASGNVGATNVLRVSGIGAAIATLLCDVLKGFLPLLGVLYFKPELAQIAGIAVLLGHLFPVWLGFKGGKGIAVSLGVFLALSWVCALILVFLWMGVVIISRYVSLGSLIATFSSSLILILAGHFDLLALSLASTCLIFFAHRNNIKNLMQECESQISFRRHRNKGS